MLQCSGAAVRPSCTGRAVATCTSPTAMISIGVSRNSRRGFVASAEFEPRLPNVPLVVGSSTWNASTIQSFWHLSSPCSTYRAIRRSGSFDPPPPRREPDPDFPYCIRDNSCYLTNSAAFCSLAERRRSSTSTAHMGHDQGPCHGRCHPRQVLHNRRRVTPPSRG